MLSGFLQPIARGTTHARDYAAGRVQTERSRSASRCPRLRPLLSLSDVLMGRARVAQRSGVPPWPALAADEKSAVLIDEEIVDPDPSPSREVADHVPMDR